MQTAILTEAFPPADMERSAPPRGGGVRRLCFSATPRLVRLRRELPATGSRAWLLEVEVEVPAVDPEQVLAQSEEFLVDDSDGNAIGVVQRVERAGAEGHAETLLVAAGWFGRRHFRVDANAVEAIEPEERRVIVDPAGVRAVDHTNKTH